MNLSKIDTAGMLLIALGLLIRYHIGKRRFKRRNLAGLQGYSSYLASQLILLLEKTFNLLGLLLIVLGLFLTVIHF